MRIFRCVLCGMAIPNASTMCARACSDSWFLSGTFSDAQRWRCAGGCGAGVGSVVLGGDSASGSGLRLASSEVAIAPSFMSSTERMRRTWPVAQPSTAGSRGRCGAECKACTEVTWVAGWTTAGAEEGVTLSEEGGVLEERQAGSDTMGMGKA